MACRACLCLVVMALPLVVQSEAPPSTPDLPIWLDKTRQVAAANCAVDIGIATVFLGKAGLAINGAVNSCPNRTTSDQKATCSANVNGILASFGFVATFVAASAAECAATLTHTNPLVQTERVCAAEIGILVSSLILAANSGSNIPITCGAKDEPPNMEAGEGVHLPEEIPDGRRLHPGGRRLQERLDPAVEERLTKLGGNKAKLLQELETAMAKIHKHQPMVARETARARGRGRTLPVEGKTPLERASCAFEIGQVTILLAHSALLMNAAVTDCSDKSLFEGGDLQKAKCTTDTSRAIGAFSFAVGAIAFAVDQCPDVVKNLEAACAGSIINFVGVLGEVLAASAAYQNSCNQLKVLPGGGLELRDPPVQPPTVAPPPTKLSFV